MSLYVSQRPAGQISQLSQEPPYDLALVSVGFEERSAAIPTSLAQPTLGIGLEFRDRHEGAYGDNHATIAAKGYELRVPDEDPRKMTAELSGWFERAVTSRQLTDRDPLRVAVDISSMTRTRIAAILEACYAQDPANPAIVDLLYAPAAYRPSDPPLASWVYAQPVTDHFAGWDPDAGKDLLTVVGLGYEPNAAEGVVDYLTPDKSVIFVPKGRDPAYQKDIQKVNAEVLSGADISLGYLVEDPYRLMLELERLVLARIQHSRVLFVPLGPKIFAAMCLLVAQRLYPMVSVWRFSAGTHDTPRPATAAGWVCGVRLATRPEATPGFDSFPGARAPSDAITAT